MSTNFHESGKGKNKESRNDRKETAWVCFLKFLPSLFQSLRPHAFVKIRGHSWFPPFDWFN